ncbi:leucyl aminopeptidase family protein [Staphylococcus sp. 17KM0847]|nr:leucyl aminopeptidase family protein [Staphylococcus sp. 17KM0847]
MGVPEHLNQLEEDAIQDKALIETLQTLKTHRLIKGQCGVIATAPVYLNKQYDRIVTVGMGNLNQLKPQDYLKIWGQLFQYLHREQLTNVTLYPRTFLTQTIQPQKIFQLMGLQMEQAIYQFDDYRSDKKAAFKVQVEWIPSDHNGMYQEAVNSGQILGRAVNRARDLSNMPPNILTPDYLATCVQSYFKNTEVDVCIKDEEALQQEGFGLIHAVGKGSINPPRLITLRYNGNPKHADDVIALVGKGITYDSGGYSIKTKTGMPSMKFDMCGAANVVGMVEAIASLKLKVNIVAVIAAAENMIANNAMKPDDVFTALSGETVEVPNTDAEGRLVLGDASFYANQFQPRVILDFATLTGAAVVALGEDKAAIFNKNEDTEILDQILASARAMDEALYELPITDTEKRNIKKSDIADLTNHVNANGKALFAAAFVTHFSGDTPHLHIDIAGPATTSVSSYKGPKGPTGVMISTIVNWLATQYENESSRS